MPTEKAKWSYVTRNVSRREAVRLLPDLAKAKSGDLILAEVVKIGSHRRLQLSDGRFSPLWPGDRIVVACGDRFAADQFEGHAELEAAGSDLLAGGGVAGRVLSKHGKIKPPTQIVPLGRLAGPDGKPVNLAQFALPPARGHRSALSILVVGTGMNAGKTAAAAGLVNGFARLGRKVAAIKATGTGAFGDMHEYEAAGAAMTLDFTDAGMPSTYRQPLSRVERAIDTLCAEAAPCDISIVELADGVCQVETAELLSKPGWAGRFNALVLAAPEAMAAMGALTWLKSRGLAPVALSGLLTQAPICVEDAATFGLPVFDRSALADPATATALEQMITAQARSAA